ncbi:hypothetical protein RSAG8_04467, partial [Rhizoctonia solani AG-8 WAC10335]
MAQGGCGDHYPLMRPTIPLNPHDGAPAFRMTQRCRERDINCLPGPEMLQRCIYASASASCLSAPIQPHDHPQASSPSLDLTRPFKAPHNEPRTRPGPV